MSLFTASLTALSKAKETKLWNKLWMQMKITWLKIPIDRKGDRLALSTEFPCWVKKFVICGGTNVINWLYFFLLSCFVCISPPSFVMSQYTFKGFPLFSGSIQYSPSPLESPESRMSLQEWAALWEYQPFALIENKKRETKRKNR